MPVRIILHERDALALYGIGYNGSGFAGMIFTGFPQSWKHLVQIVSVNFNGMPAKGVELGCERRYIKNVFGKTVKLLMVVIDDQGQIVELVVGGKHRCFPVLTFLDLAIPDHNKGVVVRMICAHTGRKRQANAD